MIARGFPANIAAFVAATVFGTEFNKQVLSSGKTKPSVRVGWTATGLAGKDLPELSRFGIRGLSDSRVTIVTSLKSCETVWL